MTDKKNTEIQLSNGFNLDDAKTSHRHSDQELSEKAHSMLCQLYTDSTGEEIAHDDEEIIRDRLKANAESLNL